MEAIKGQAVDAETKAQEQPSAETRTDKSYFFSTAARQKITKPKPLLTSKSKSKDKNKHLAKELAASAKKPRKGVATNEPVKFHTNNGWAGLIAQDSD